MTFRTPAGCAARHRADWPSVQAAWHRLRAFWTSPRHLNSRCWGRTCMRMSLRSIAWTDGQFAFTAATQRHAHTAQWRVRGI